ncbi:MAG: formate dehydrogenase accessory protein FdhE, partial [Ilumatobacter sp.]|nr:formate dehydrogenase accessory protein FdhE [Ilumatobacter sp.]
ARRARPLGGDRPHTAPLLQFYLSVREVQTFVCAAIDVAPWAGTVETPHGADGPRLQLERMPLGALSVEFSAFCRAIPDNAPQPVGQAARALAGAETKQGEYLLLSMLTGEDLAPLADVFGCEMAPLAFLPRAFLSPVAETLSALGPADGAATASVCPQCGWPPLVSQLEDESHTEGVRRLLCAFCATDWTFPRAVCPACGVSGESGLEFHVDEGLAHMRIEACQTCRRYLKSVDRRVLGFADPLVDDLATPELDLWATEHGLNKIAPNLLGL